MRLTFYDDECLFCGGEFRETKSGEVKCDCCGRGRDTHAHEKLIQYEEDEKGSLFVPRPEK